MDAELTSLGNKHAKFLESVMLASGFMGSQWQTVKYEDSVEKQAWVPDCLNNALLFSDWRLTWKQTADGPNVTQ